MMRHDNLHYKQNRHMHNKRPHDNKSACRRSSCTRRCPQGARNLKIASNVHKATLCVDPRCHKCGQVVCP
jgi:hypothetical protein